MMKYEMANKSKNTFWGHGLSVLISKSVLKKLCKEWYEKIYPSLVANFIVCWCDCHLSIDLTAGHHSVLIISV